MNVRCAQSLVVMLLAGVVSASVAAGRGPAATKAHDRLAPERPAGRGPAATDSRDRLSPVLRVCADPNNLPFSNERGEGFENRLADLLAGARGQRVEYTWWAQRRGFLRSTLNAGSCDVVMGLPTSVELAATTRPYYRSSYVFVWRADRDRELGSLSSLDDARLAGLRLGVQLLGDDIGSSPPALALARRGVIDNVRAYSVFGDYREASPPARIVEAVADGEVDAALVWGPLAGYFAARQAVELRLAPVTPEIDLPFLPMVYDIAVGVRRDDAVLREQLDALLEERREEVDALLAEYGVPRVDQR